VMRFAPVPNCRSLSGHRAEFYPTKLKPIRLKYYLRHFGVRGKSTSQQGGLLQI
jgi:hypothetical protein